MDRATFVSHQPFAGEKKPSMLRRRVGHDYQSRCIYLLTLTIEGRQPLLGTLHGLEETDTPYVELTPLGECVEERWQAIEVIYPEVKILATKIMPDHMHGILFVQEQSKRHLGEIVKGFKTGCNIALRRLAAEAATRSQHRGTESHFQIPEALPFPTQPPTPAAQASAFPTRQALAAQSNLLSPYAATASPPSKPSPTRGLLWSYGYNDHILEGRGELDRWFAYLQDNPRRLAIRRAHPDYFRVRFGVRVGGQEFAAIGNRFLLDYPDKRQVQLTRSLSETQIEAEVQKHLLLAQRGSVLVSPAISRGEQAVMRAVLDARLPLIFLTPWGFNEFSKPGHQYFEACADGRFLILAPWPHENQRIALSREMCLTLNNMTNNICNQTSEYGFN
jgi:REP element-mobilizing transposase RayT